MRTCPYGPLRSALYIVHTRTNGTLLPLFRTEFRPTHLTTNALLPKTPHSQLRCLMPRLQWQPFVPHDDNERLEQDKLSWACARINGGKPIPHVTVWGGAPLLSSANCTRGSYGPCSEKPSSPAAAANQDNQLPPRRSGLRGHRNIRLGLSIPLRIADQPPIETLPHRPHSCARNWSVPFCPKLRTHPLSDFSALFSVRPPLDAEKFACARGFRFRGILKNKSIVVSTIMRGLVVVFFNSLCFLERCKDPTLLPSPQIPLTLKPCLPRTLRRVLYLPMDHQLRG